MSVGNYIREIHLESLLRLKMDELKDKSHAGNLRIINRLKKELYIQSRKGADRHWSYDRNYHLALLAAYKAEVELMKQHD